MKFPTLGTYADADVPSSEISAVLSTPSTEK